jgi:hypothetical protein
MALVWLALAPAAQARTFLSAEEALKSAFPECELKKDTLYLSTDQAKRVFELAGSHLMSAIVIRWVVTCGGKTSAYGYTDMHRVRTHPENLMILVDASGKLKRIEVLSFDEPTEYMPKEEWYGQFAGHKLDSELALKRAIPPVTGASLTSRATTEAARRVLAIHAVAAGN